MTLPAAPLPGVKSLVWALTARAFPAERWLQGRQGYMALTYHRGSFALAAGLEAVRRNAAIESVAVWIPAYFCNEALDPVRFLSVKIKFYPIQQDLTPDWSYLGSQVERQVKPQVLVLVHYFGFPNALEKARNFCDQYGMMLLEDAAHVLLPDSVVGRGDLVVFSPRKLLAVPSGGILLATEELVRELAVAAGKKVRGETLQWIIRRLAQKCFTGLHIPWHFLWTSHGKVFHSTIGNGFVRQSDLGCDSYGLRLLTVMAGQVDYVIEKRRGNYQRLMEWVSEIVPAVPLFRNLPDGVCPYAFPLLLNRGGEDAVAKLRSWGIPASRWPDLAPEILTGERKYKVAIETYKQLMLLPVHQSLTLKQVDWVGQRLRAALSYSS